LTPLASDQAASRSAGRESDGVQSPGCSGDGAPPDAGLAERTADPAAEPDVSGPAPRRVLGSTARRAAIVVVAIAVFLTIGLPRWLQHDSGSGAGDPAATFAKVCRDHGGTLGSSGGQPRCTVRYGGTVYLMDAVTPTGFDEDTAGFQKQGCQQARADAAPGSSTVFVYHPTTGVCEHRP
jgi:hypothetical protein